jgi:hypothetical protein
MGNFQMRSNSGSFLTSNYKNLENNLHKSIAIKYLIRYFIYNMVVIFAKKGKHE